MSNFSPFLRRHLAAQQTPTGDHPDANLLLAFAERNLSRPEYAAILAHLAECADCREVLALSSSVTPQEVHSHQHPAWWAWRLAAAAALICAVIASLWWPSLFKSSPNTTLSSKPLVISSPPLAAPAPLGSKQTDPGRVTRRIRAARKKEFSHPPDHVQLAQRSDTPSVAKSAAEAEKFSEPVIIAAPEAKLQPSPPGALKFSASDRVQNSRLPERARETALWTLEGVSRPGTVRKSDDGGKSWRSISVDEATSIYALSASGSNVWVGGSGGKLFHSVDDGTHWMTIPVANEDTTLDSAIIGIDARGQAVILKTNSGATWTTEDGGAHWRRE